MYTPAQPAYTHQLIALERIKNRPNYPSSDDVFALLMEQGSGKSKVILDEFGEREDASDLRNLLIIGPKGAYINWYEKEIPEHLSVDLQERTLIGVWRSGADVTRKRELEKFLATQDQPRILLVNIESLSTVQEAVDLCDTFINQRRTLMVIDESTRIKGIAEQTTRARNVIDLGARAYARRILTGMIAPRSPLDLYSQFEFLDYRILGYRSYYAFRSRYAIIKKQQLMGRLMRGAGGKVQVDSEGNAVRVGARTINLVVGYYNVEELHEKIAPYSYRVLKEDCLDLPPKVYLEPRRVELTDQQRRMLKELKTTAQAQLDTGEYVSTNMKMVTLLRMHQIICGHVKDENGKEHAVPSNRIKAMLEVLDEQQGKAIIWSGFTYCIREIIEALRKEYGPGSVVHYYGATKEADRSEAKRRFQDDPRCRWLVANQQSAAWALTLTAASLMLYFNNTWNLEERAQSEDRAHRAGLKHSVAYQDLVANGAEVEKKLITCLRKKLDIASIISGDSYREWII